MNSISSSSIPLIRISPVVTEPPAPQAPQTAKVGAEKPKSVSDREVEVQAQLRLVFDFDGVIADSGDVLFESLNAVAERKKRPLFTRSDLSDMGTRELINKLGLRWYTLPYWVRIVLKEFKSRSGDVKLHPNIVPVLEWAATQNVETVIVSSNAPEVIRAFLDRHVPQARFTKIVGDVAVFGKGKAIKRQRDKMHRTVYIGDETRDVVAARAAGVQSIAVTWGKDSPAVLAKESPTYQVTSGEELVDVARKLL